MKLPFSKEISSPPPPLSITEDNLAGANVFFGTGLVSSKGITTGVPLDFLEFLNSARQMRSVFRGKIVHILADSIARNVTPQEKHAELKNSTEKCEQQYADIYQKLGIKDQVVFIKSSDIEKSEHYASILNQIDPVAHGVPETAQTYVKSQLALMHFMKQHMHCAMKISWAVDLTKDARRDEDFFDRFYEKQFGKHNLIFYYGTAGLSMKGMRPCVPPYIMLEDERSQRLAFDSTPEEIDAFFEGMQTKTSRSAKKRKQAMEQKLERVIRRHEGLSSDLNGNTVREKIYDLLEKFRGDGFPKPDPNRLFVSLDPTAVPNN